MPFGYESLRLYADLPAEMVSHTRRRPATPGLLVGDVDLYDNAGALVARIEGFTMRKVGDDFGDELTDSGQAEDTRIHGIDPDLGGRLLLSLLVPSCPAQVCVRPHVDGVASRMTRIAGEPLPSRAGQPTAQRQAAPFVGPVPAAAEATGPESDVRNRLAKLWHNVLGIYPDDDEADFFELGGNSLSAVELVSAIQAEFGIRPSIVALFDSPSLRALADLVAQNNGTSA
jgi:acyl carrier protein